MTDRIADALLAGGPGVLTASAAQTIDGFAIDLAVVVRFDRASITTADLRAVLQIIVASNAADNLHRLELTGLDGTVDEYRYVTLESTGDDLGFTTNSTSSTLVDARWEYVARAMSD